HFTVVREEDLTGRRGDGSQNAACRRGFSAAALSDERQGLASIEEEGHVVHRLHLADGLLEKPLSNGEILLEPLDVEERRLFRTGGAILHCRPLRVIGRENSSPFFHSQPPEAAGPGCRSGRVWRKRSGDGKGNPS